MSVLLPWLFSVSLTGVHRKLPKNGNLLTKDAVNS